MSRRVNRAELEGYPVQYGELTDIINEALNVFEGRGIRLSNLILETIGRLVSPFVRHELRITTNDGYTWFGGLIYRLDKAKVAILFPWAQDWEDPASTADSSIGVYSTERIRYKTMRRLLEKIASQFKKFPACSSY